MLFRQVLHEDLGCASYFVADASAGIAATRMHWHAQEDTPSTLQTPPTPVG